MRMIQIKTKYNIGDQVRKKIKSSKTEEIVCPFCAGEGYVEYGDKPILCDACDESGRYVLETEQYVWSSRKEVVGAVIKSKPSYENGEFKMIDKVHICITNSIYSFYKTDCYPEEELIFADEVERGDPVYEENEDSKK